LAYQIKLINTRNKLGTKANIYNLLRYYIQKIVLLTRMATIRHQLVHQRKKHTQGPLDDDYVDGFDVAMGDTFRMQVFQATQHFVYEIFKQRLFPRKSQTILSA